MNSTLQRKALALAFALGCGAAGSLTAAPPATAASLSPCPLTTQEVEAVFRLTVDRTETSDMTVPGGRDAGCLYTFKDSSFELTVRQTWEESRAGGAAVQAEGAKAVAHDPDGATWKAQATDRPGAGGDLSYLRGKVRTRIQVRGGRLTAAEVLQRVLLLRRVP